MTTKISADNIQASTLENLGGSPTITGVEICDSSYVTLDDTAVALTGGYIRVLGTRFTTGCQVLIDQVAASAVTFVSSTELRVQVPALTAGTYIVYVVNTDGSTAIRINGLTASATPSWVTGSTLPEGGSGVAISIQLVASSATTYTLAAGSSLPEGLTLSSTGLLSGTITTSTETTYNFSVVATDAELQDSPRSFSVNITVGDAQIAYVTTLLSPQVAQPFVADSSTNNFALTVSGDVRPNNYNPYLSNYSTQFTAKTSYVSVPAVTSLTTFTGDFTFEAWIHPTDTTITYWGIWDSRQSGGSAQAMGINIEPLASPVTGRSRLKYYNGTSYFSTGTIFYNRWTHVALVRSGTTLTFYVDGIASGSATVSGTQTGTATTNPIWIGSKDNAVANYGTTGFMSNLRVVNGTAVYTANFTPSTVPLTAITNTALLVFQNNRYSDNSANAYTLTPVTTAVSGHNPFTQTTSTNGSGYFDGTGDFLTTATGSLVQFGTGDFTVEAWAYLTTLASYNGIFDSRTLGGTGIAITVFANGTLECGSGGAYVTSGAGAFVANRWNHVAFIRTGNTARIFVNGVQVASATHTVDYTATYALIGKTNDGWHCTGYISNVRVVKGTAVYTTAFAPPAQPLTAVSNTSLLTLQSNQSPNNNVFLDSSANSFLVTRAGNATQGAFSPYGGGWSNYFDGNGDSITTPTNSAFALGTGNFTVEFWLNFNSTANRQDIVWWGVDGNDRGGLTWNLTAGNLTYYISPTVANAINYAFTPVVGTWYHIALVRDSGSTKLYVNGAQAGTTYSDTKNYASSSYLVTVGKDNAAASSYLNGYISNLRIVKGTALYTANFTPPTEPLKPITGTSLLTCCDNRLIDDSTNNFTIARAGDVRVEKFNPFGVVTGNTPLSYSAYFDGTGDFLSIALATGAYSLGTGDFTVEMWVNLPSYIQSTNSTVFIAGGSNSLSISLDTAGKLRSSQWGGSVIVTSANTIALNQWVHISVTRQGTTVRHFINGVLDGSGTSSATLTGSSATRIGQDPAASANTYTGYISNLRIVKGTALYTTNFTPSTTALTAVSGTSLLACQSDRLVDASTNNFAITASGDARPSQTNPFGFSSGTKTSYTPAIYGGSVRFDGTGDYLDLPNNVAFGQTGSWTLETWVYLTGSTNNYLYSQVTSNFLQLNISATNTIIVDRSGVGTLITSSSPIPLNTWTHIAVVSDGTNIKLFVNGVQSGSTAAVGTQALSAATTRIGAYQSNGTLAYPGFISDMRLVKGTAVYTGNFVPPIAPLQSVPGTVLLLNGTGAAVYDSSTANNLETVGDVGLNTSVVKYGNTSTRFDGTGDYLSVSSSVANQSTAFGTGSFTVEFWFNATSNSGTQQLFDTRPAGTTNTAQYIALTYISGSLNYYTAGAAPAIAGGTVTPGIWNHVALTRSGTSTRLFINGTQAGSTFTDSQNYLGSVNRPILATDGNTPNTANFTGSISDLRITKGIARYTANFTPPTSALKTK